MFYSIYVYTVIALLNNCPMHGEFPSDAWLKMNSRGQTIFKGETNVFLCPLEKGGILFCNGRSVCLSVYRSVGRSVDQVVSAKYLLTPSPDQYQTWCRGCPH